MINSHVTHNSLILNIINAHTITITITSFHITHHTSSYNHLYHVISHTSHITYHISHITYHISHITYHISHITYHISHITYHTSHITYHISHITHHTSHITHHRIFTPIMSFHTTHHTSHITHHISSYIHPYHARRVWGHGYWCCCRYNGLCGTESVKVCDVMMLGGVVMICVVMYDDVWWCVMMLDV